MHGILHDEIDSFCKQVLGLYVDNVVKRTFSILSTLFCKLVDNILSIIGFFLLHCPYFKFLIACFSIFILAFFISFLFAVQSFVKILANRIAIESVETLYFLISSPEDKGS